MILGRFKAMTDSADWDTVALYPVDIYKGRKVD